jgi:hypothetical protein
VYGFSKSVDAIAGIAMSRFDGSAGRVLNSEWDPDATIDKKSDVPRGVLRLYRRSSLPRLSPEKAKQV